ncbi:glucitol operon repressor [Athalassotoga saccharophila]|nr:glucitol operon repressor [Athalassotoga saccharophila]
MELVNERDFLSIDEMKKLLNVSEITIRRDMKELNDRALVQKVYGGIKKIDSNPPEAQFAQRRMSHANEKALIAKIAVELVEDGDTIFIDASSTTFEFARVCREKRNNLHVVTTSLVTALELIKNPTNTVTIIGGMVRSDNMSVIGTTAEKMAENLNVEKTFISCRTFEPNEGTFETNPSESVIKSTMADNSNKIYLLVDSSKLFKKSTFLTVPVEKIDAVVTDGRVDELIKALPDKVKVFYDLRKA